jgi:hypothetical protein
MSEEVISYNDLIRTHQNPRLITYIELLKTKEWHAKCKEIRKRDSSACVKCKRPESEKIDIKTLQSLLKTKDTTVKWQISGKEHTVTTRLYSGDYWLLSESTFKKFDTYNCFKYVKTPKDMILIKAKRPYTLEVHHKFYILNQLPWENYNKDLETQCNWCHSEFHKFNQVKAYNKINGKLIPAKLTPCARCGGYGRIAKFEHIENGICFRCRGHKFEELIVPDSSNFSISRF